MKRNVLIFFAAFSAFAFFAAAAFAQESSLKLSGEAKSGIYWERTQQESTDPVEEVNLKNTDDAGSGRGRFRLNMDYDNGKNFGFQSRFNWETWSDTQPQWPYAFGYGKFFDDQLRISVGKLGGSPWGTGGPEMWKEVEAGAGGGMRVEYKPLFIPEEYGKLNVGFVLNYFNSDRDQGWDANKKISLLNILNESVIGVSYTHDLFLVRLAYRFDDEYDAIQDNKITSKGEDELVYRVEERVLKNFLPGLQIWAIGHLFALTAEKKDIQWFRNWLFIQYAPDQFTAQLRFGLDYVESRSDFYVKPSFYWYFFDRLLSVGAAFAYCQDFGDGKMYEGSPYRYLELQPKVQINFTSSYVAFEYYFKQEYLHPWPELAVGKDPLKQTHWMNLRFCIYF